MKSVRIRWIPAVILLLPIVEIIAIIAVARWVGWLPTVAALAALSIAGVLLVRHTGRQAWADLAQDQSVGKEPTRSVADRAMIFIGGLLLIPPGFVKDVAALVLLLPFTRPLLRNRIQSWAVRQGSMYVTTRGGPGMGAPAGGSRHGPTTPHGPDVVRGEVIEDT